MVVCELEDLDGKVQCEMHAAPGRCEDAHLECRCQYLCREKLRFCELRVAQQVGVALALTCPCTEEKFVQCVRRAAGVQKCGPSFRRALRNSSRRLDGFDMIYMF